MRLHRIKEVLTAFWNALTDKDSETLYFMSDKTTNPTNHVAMGETIYGSHYPVIGSKTGTVGVAALPGDGETAKYLKGDGTWDIPFTLGVATNTTLGGVKLGYEDSGKNYKVQVDNSGNAYVYVPWTDSSYTLTTATSSTLGGVKLGSDTVQSTTAEAVSTTSGRTYAVQLNSSDQMVVNVPWSDTTYTEASSSRSGLMSKTDKSYIDNLKQYTMIEINDPSNPITINLRVPYSPVLVLNTSKQIDKNAIINYSNNGSSVEITVLEQCTVYAMKLLS